MKKIYTFDYSSKTKPFPHQVEATLYIENHSTSALFDEQGLGKTKIVIDALCNNIKNEIIDSGLIICKKQLINNWKQEIEKHSHLKYTVLAGTQKKKGLGFLSFSHFYIINYEQLIPEIERVMMFLKIKKAAVVLDESHKIKNPRALITKIVHSISDYSVKRIIISGTPVANAPIDLWSQFYFLDKGELLGNSFSAFDNKYFGISDKLKNEKESISRMEELGVMLSNNSIRRLKLGVLNLPEKNYHFERVVLSGAQETMYNKVNNELYLEVLNSENQLIIDNSEYILKKLLRLIQIASNPFLIDKSYSETPSKYKLMDSLVKRIISKQEKLIIWSCFVENIQLLKQRYNQHNAVALYGRVSMDNRANVVDKFMNNKNVKILVANPSTAREGLTLTSANNAIYLDRNFNLVDYLQSQDRIHRISQERECNIYKIIANNTIDEYVEQTLLRKHNVAKFVQGDLANKDVVHGLTKDELLQVLGGNNDKE